MWSTFKEYKNKLKGKGYTKSFCQYNIRLMTIDIVQL